MESPETTASAVVDHRKMPAAPSWTVSTNWTIASGSILSSVAVESSFSPLEDTAAKSPLILCPSSSDSSPCEITNPVDEDNLNNQVCSEENNTSGNSLMAIDQDSGIVLANEKHKLVDIGNIETDPTDAAEEIRHEDASSSLVNQETELPDTVVSSVVSSVVPIELGISQHAADAEDEHGKPTSQPEGILDHLVSRVDRIEDLLLRFEERMLKPLNNIDERLQRVEHQLDVLTKKTEDSRLISCTRISAPEFSCGESESNSSYDCGYMDSGYVASEDKKDLPASSDISEIPIPVDASKMFPSLQVSAPEFSNYDVAPETVEEDLEDQDHVARETVKEAPDNRTIRAVSIDDALASALAGFLTSTAVPSQSCLVSVKAPEFSTQDESIDVSSASPEVDPYINSVEPVTSADRTQCGSVQDSIGNNGGFARFASIGNNVGFARFASIGNNVQVSAPEFSNYKAKSVLESSSKHNKQKTINERSESWFCNMLNIASPEDVGADHTVEDINNEKAATLTGNILDPNNTGGLEEISKNLNADDNDAIQEIATSVEPVTSADRTQCGSVQDSIGNNVGFARFASVGNNVGFARFASIEDTLIYAESHV